MRIADIFALVRRKRKNGAGAGRVAAPLVVHFWTGGAPRAHEVRRVTAKGAYVVTADRWYPGTVLRMSFGYGQAAAKPPGIETSGVSMRGKVVGSDANGLYVEFVYLAPEERDTFSRFLETAPVEARR